MGEGGLASSYHEVMAILARIIALLGLVLVIVAAVFLAKTVIDINQLHAMANANRSTTFFNPVYNVIWSAAAAAVGGLLTGLGAGMMTRRRTAVLPK